MVHGEVGVRQGLGLDALGGVHYQQRTLAGRERAADLIVEVHVSRGVDEVERILLAVGGLVGETHGAGLYRDAALAFKVHVVEYLALHLAALHRAAELYEPVRKSRFAVVYVRYYRKIPDVVLSHILPSSAMLSTLSAMARSSFERLRSRSVSAAPPGSSVLPSR